MVVDADSAWVDMQQARYAGEAAALGTRLKLRSTIFAGLDTFPLPFLAERGVIVTNGNGLNAHTVADYAVMGILVAAKRFDEVVRIADRREWPFVAPGQAELAGSRALVIGYGTIGRLIGHRLAAVEVAAPGAPRPGRTATQP